MEKNGFIQKIQSQKDKRASQVFLAPKGEVKLQHALPLVKSYNQNIMELFNPNELQIILHFLDTIIDKFHTAPDNFFKNQASLLSVHK